MWYPYLAMAAVVIPLLLMGIGYFVLGSRRRRSELKGAERPANSDSPSRS